MSQPPYPPQGGNEPGGEPSASRGWDPPGGVDDPTQRFGVPGGAQRDPTRQFGEPQYGPPQYGPPGQPPYGQQWAPPGGPGAQRPKGSNRALIALIVAGIVVLAAIAVTLFLALGTDGQGNLAGTTTAASSSAQGSPSTSGRSSSSSGALSSSSVPTGSSGIPPATMPPDGLGKDAVLNQEARRCYDGDMAACDQLYRNSEVGSRYEVYGGTCAGRQPVGNTDTVYCVDAFTGA